MHLENDTSAIRYSAISYIGIAHKSTGQVRSYLKRKGHEGAGVESVIQDLVRDGYVDDVRVARAMIRQRTGSKAEAKRMLRRRLLAAGISDAAVEECEGDFQSDEESIAELVQRKCLPEYSRLCNREDFSVEKWLQKSARFLIARGYGSSLVLRVLKAFVSESFD